MNEPRQTLSILVVDDDKTMASGVSDTLTEAGYSATIATGAAAAVFQLVQDTQRKIDLVVADIHMPDLNGLALYEHLLACRPEMGERFIFITGGRVDADVADVINDGGARLVLKPFRSRELLDAVAGAASALN